MSIDLQAERLELKDVAELAGVDLSTVWRWCQKGVRGQKLKSFRLGGRRYVLRDAFDSFVAAQNTDADAGDVKPPAAAARRADEAEAQAKAIVG